MIKDINPTGDSEPRGLIVVDDQVYFRADDGHNGIELWVSDGTGAGTYLYEDLNPEGHSYPQKLVYVNDTLFFIAYDKDHGWVVWKSFP